MTVRMRERYVEQAGDLTKAGYDVLNGIDRRVSDVQADVDAIISGGTLAESFETVSKNLRAVDAVLNYSGGDLVSIVYANGITKTFGYSGGNLSTVTLSGATPGGISLSKGFTYSGGDLVAVDYS